MLQLYPLFITQSKRTNDHIIIGIYFLTCKWQPGFCYRVNCHKTLTVIANFWGCNALPFTHQNEIISYIFQTKADRFVTRNGIDILFWSRNYAVSW